MPAFAWTRAKNEKHFNVKLAPGTVETDESESQHLNTKPVRSQVRARAGATAVERCADAACVTQRADAAKSSRRNIRCAALGAHESAGEGGGYAGRAPEVSGSGI